MINEIKQVIIIRSDLNMGKGKIAAQACHASVINSLKIYKKDKELFESWESMGQKKIVLKISSKSGLLKLYDSLKRKETCTLIKDAGLTQLTPGESTCLSVGPCKSEKIDLLIKHLKLL